jgi:hypothetical protein
VNLSVVFEVVKLERLEIAYENVAGKLVFLEAWRLVVQVHPGPPRIKLENSRGIMSSLQEKKTFLALKYGKIVLPWKRRFQQRDRSFFPFRCGASWGYGQAIR